MVRRRLEMNLRKIIDTIKERVRYLSVPSELNMKLIEDDMQTGKVIFQGLLDQLKKAPVLPDPCGRCDKSGFRA